MFQPASTHSLGLCGWKKIRTGGRSRHASSSPVDACLERTRQGVALLRCGVPFPLALNEEPAIPDAEERMIARGRSTSQSHRSASGRTGAGR
jgi:hypothetical protein